MSSEPFIGPAEQALFDIKDTRERADRLREQLTPKVAAVFDWACGEIEDIYGEDALEPYRFSLTPAHRPKAKKTGEFHVASVGLIVKGDHWYFQQRIECSNSALKTRVFGLRGRETAPLVAVLQRHREEAVRLLEFGGYLPDQHGLHVDGAGDEQLDPNRSIGRLRTGSERDWRAGVIIDGEETDLPLLEEDSAWPVIIDFIALFPIFRAATDLLLGQEDRFLTYVRKFWEWDERTEGEPGETPGGEEEGEGEWENNPKVALRRHRTREKRLREKKIREALRLDGGRLRCEVPGCGFDFYHAYGEIGRSFAHVHHKNLLSANSAPIKTRLSDLAIVCANCHAMIHRGKGQCRPLEGLIKNAR